MKKNLQKLGNFNQSLTILAVHTAWLLNHMVLCCKCFVAKSESFAVLNTCLAWMAMFKCTFPLPPSYNMPWDISLSLACFCEICLICKTFKVHKILFYVIWTMDKLGKKFNFFFYKILDMTVLSAQFWFKNCWNRMIYSRYSKLIDDIINRLMKS